MAGEETEQVGGIGIGVQIDDSSVDPGLNALLAKIQAASKQLSAAMTIQPTVGQGQVAPQQRAQQPTQVSFGAKAAGGATAREATRFEQAVQQALAKQGIQMADATVDAIDTARQATTQRVTQALSATAGQQATAIPLTLDASEFREQFAQFLTELKTMTAQASRMATVSPELDEDMVPGTGGGKSKKARRKNIRDRSIGTEADPSRIYTFDPSVYEEEDRRTAAKSAQQQQALLTAHERRKVSTSDAEQRFVNTLQATQAPAVRPGTDPQVERDLQEMAYEIQAERKQKGEQFGSSTFAAGGRNRTPDEVERYKEEEARRSQEVARQMAGRRKRTPEEEARFQAAAAGPQGSSERYQTPDERKAAGRGGAGGRASATTPEDLERRSAAGLAISESQRLTAARTSRTFASGLGGFFLGQTRQQAEAASTLRRSEQELTIARRRLNSPEIIANTRAYRQAQEEVAVAETKVAASLQKVQSFTSGVSAARTLAAVTVAGAAFGIGLRAVDTVIGAVGQGFNNLVDIQTGFVGTSSRVTGELAKQTQALHGNVDAVLANAEANAGLSAAGAEAVNSQLRLATQIKAGALAQQQASDLFRAAQGAGGAQSGLTGGFGGLFGTSLFGQQLGGGRGLSELIQEDVSSLSQGRGKNPLEGISQGLAYAFNDNVRKTVDQLADEQGRNRPSAPFDIAFRGTLGNAAGDAFGIGPGLGQAPPTRTGVGTLAGGVGSFGPPGKATEALTGYLNDLTAAAGRGASATDNAAKVEAVYTTNTREVAAASAAAAAAGDAYGVSLAQQQHVVLRLNGAVADTAEEYKKALEQIAIGRSRVDPQVLAKQFEFERPALLAGAERQQQFALGTQQPAEAALRNLAAPPAPIGTGIVAANADEQERIVAGQQRSIELQANLNDYYEQGRQVLIDTYKVPPALLGQVSSIGQEIANISAGIANEQAAYQVAQYNFQLNIARRTLGDIGGLTGKNFGAGESYLGVLERQNLALSRQGQLLQFSLAQRQINFQQAVAGFQAPGVTPEERQANVKEAQIEASFAQKQLDIQTKMFGNQVQIVDIQNLRQGADLAAQIGLLLQGRQVTIDTAQAQETLGRLQQQQSILVGQVGTYLTKVNSVTAVAFGQIQQLEAAAGRAMYSTAYSVLDAFGLVINGLTNSLNQLGGQSGGLSPTERDEQNNASGYVGTTSGRTMTGVGWMGEANQETYAILRNPKALTGLGGGGGDVTVNFGDVYVRDDGDIDKVARAVVNVIGRSASLTGLRLGG